LDGKAAIIGDTLREELFGGGDPIGEAGADRGYRVAWAQQILQLRCKPLNRMVVSPSITV
jgi:hypothetical protein